MPQQLSAMRYIKNNKQRVSVLIVSLTLCFTLTYLTQFMLSTTTETFLPLTIEIPQRVIFLELAGSSLGIDVDNLTSEEISAEYAEKREALTERLRRRDGVLSVSFPEILYCKITPPIGEWYYEVPLVEKEELPVWLAHFDARLSRGRMPEQPGELILDEASMKNNGYRLNDYFAEEDYKTAYKIVGIADCDVYFGCGIPTEKYPLNHKITILSDGSIRDMSAVLREEGVNVRDTYDSINDYVNGKKTLEEIESDIADATTYLYVGIMILLFISLFIVYTTYLRDRRNEWCLYCSIGYSRKSIYASILRELLFTFGAAFLLGGLLITISVILSNHFLLQQGGLRCRYLYPATLGQIFCSYALLMGLLQIPIRYSLYKIKTIDAMDDELYQN